MIRGKEKEEEGTNKKEGNGGGRKDEEKEGRRKTEGRMQNENENSNRQWLSLVYKGGQKVYKGGQKCRQMKNILEKQVATIQRQKTKRGSSKIVFIIGHPRLWMVESLWAFWSIYI